MIQPIVPPFGEPFDLSQYDPRDHGELTKQDGQEELDRLVVRVDELQNVLFAAQSHAVLVVVQGIDASGKDGTVNAVFRAAGPAGCRVVHFGVPTEEELAHDYLWRYQRPLPRKGEVVIFNRSYYEAVLVERVRKLVPEDMWKLRYGDINAFERYLVHQGTVILKFFLHLSKAEQRERLQERLDNPRKRWKFRKGDLDERNRWDDYQAAFQDMIERCNTDIAPWHVVPADRHWYRNLVVARAIVRKLESLGLDYPQPEEDLTGVTIV